jgi:multicomponent Na+:H+ antiporter subunit B
MKQHRRWRPQRNKVLFYAIVLFIVICVNYLLLLVVMELPLYGHPQNPARNEVVERYVEKGVEESGGYNLVSNILLDYRGFDTFLETTVIFSAVVAVTLTLASLKHKDFPR